MKRSGRRSRRKRCRGLRVRRERRYRCGDGGKRYGGRRHGGQSRGQPRAVRRRARHPPLDHRDQTGLLVDPLFAADLLVGDLDRRLGRAAREAATVRHFGVDGEPETSTGGGERRADLGVVVVDEGGAQCLAGRGGEREGGRDLGRPRTRAKARRASVASSSKRMSSRITRSSVVPSSFPASSRSSSIAKAASAIVARQTALIRPSGRRCVRSGSCRNNVQKSSACPLGRRLRKTRALPRRIRYGPSGTPEIPCLARRDGRFGRRSPDSHGSWRIAPTLATSPCF